MFTAEIKAYTKPNPTGIAKHPYDHYTRICMYIAEISINFSKFKHYNTNMYKSCCKLIYKSKKRVTCIKTIGQRVTFNKYQHCIPKLR